MSVIERDELIARLIEADEALFEDGETISHRDSAEAALRVVEDYIDQRLRGAVCLTDAERERVLWWLHKPVPPGPMKELDEAIIRKLNGARP